MEIKVLGAGCPRCDHLKQEVMAVMVELKLAADIEHVTDIAEIGRYGVMGTPALIINGKVAAVGSVPSKAQIKAWVKEASKN
ncbi:MAG: thioredoxin family protein [Desulfobacteraceae bacterium]|nr:MAG: thioredoxin family protein [Desulfobacteraceae bacterium]